MAIKGAKYTEPDDYIPEEIRKKLKLGEYAEEEDNQKTNENIRKYVNE